MGRTVLVGGCFDLLHKGHITFLKKAKGVGKLIVLLESDEKIRKLKGEDRPSQTPSTRARVLMNSGFVDQIISLPYLESEKDYDEIIKKIKPDVIAITAGYPIRYHKRSAGLVGAKLKVVSKIVGNYSTSRLINRKVI